MVASFRPRRLCLSTADRYLLREIAAPFGVSLGVVTVLVFVFQGRKLAASTLGLGLGLDDVLVIFVSVLPPFLVLAVPLALLLSVLIGLGRLRADRELQAVYTAGIGPLRLARIPVLFGGIISVISLPLSIWGQPAGMQVLHDRLVDVGLENLSRAIRPGVFNQDFSGSAVYAARRTPDGALEDVLIFDDRNPSPPVLVLAQQGRVVRDPRSLAFMLQRGELHLFDAPDPTPYHRLSFERGRIGLDTRRELATRTQFMSALLMRPTFTLLSDAEAKRPADAPLSRRMTKAFWRRFAVPSMALVFAVIGCAIELRNRSTSHARSAVLGLSSVLVYYVMMRTADIVVVRYPGTPFWAVWLPNVLLLAAGYVALRRAHRAG